MKRRAFIALLGGAAPIVPALGRAQQATMPLVGVLGIFSPESYSTPMAGLRKGLSETGFVEGRNVAIESSQLPGAQYDRLLAVAKELVRRPVHVLVATGTANVARAAKAATATTPVVFSNGSDPVKIGLVASMNRPGGNLTGVSFLTSTLGPKRLELLRELVPQATTMALLVNPANPVTAGDIDDMQAAARSVGQNIVVTRAGNESEIDAAFAALARDRIGAVIVNVDAFFASRRYQLAALAARYQVPASFNNSEYVKAGGLMSYGDDRLDSYRQVGAYVGRILKGERPSDLPVLQPTKFDLVINLQVAKALDIKVPPTLLARANDVIE